MRSALHFTDALYSKQRKYVTPEYSLEAESACFARSLIERFELGHKFLPQFKVYLEASLPQ